MPVRGIVPLLLRVAVAVIIIPFFGVVVVFFLFFLDGLFSKQDIGVHLETRSISGRTLSKESTHLSMVRSSILGDAILQDPFTCYHSDGGGYVFLLFQVF